MSKVLIIRHLPLELSFQDKEKLLKHFGAEKVWETIQKRNYVFASFSSVEKATASLGRLHQLEIAKRRLVVEYSVEKEPDLQKQDTDESSIATKQIKEFLKVLNAWNPSVDFYQPPPVHLKYKYPDPTPNTLINIIHTILTNKPFYIQTIHLMNKMSLDVPFAENGKCIEFFKEYFKHLFHSELVSIPLPKSESESEMSSDESELPQHQINKPLVKRKHMLPVTRKRAAAVLATATLPKAKKPAINQEEVFESPSTIQEPKKISLVVHQDALTVKTTEEAEIVGELGKFQKETPAEEEKTENVTLELPVITKKELFKNRISYNDMKILPVFKNYHPGQPSMRLYIKNLAKTVTEQDMKSIYKRYIDILSEEEQIGFDVRLMQEGRMKGQAFITFPSLELAEKALNETNGYLLKEKPMVVQFARVANKTN